MVACVAVGALTSFAFIIVLLFVSDDLNSIITSGHGPLLQVLLDATFPIVCLLMGIVARPPPAARYSLLAVDNPFLTPEIPECLLTVLDEGAPALGTPLDALGLTAVLTLCCGCIYLDSST
ncbi:putative choline transporter [Aspergillus udagawae]|nr:putative choline transporter [Aspergillus udagawae]GFF48218.1 putative choline transporter [Aspergillus udagawae]GFG14168.1 putative choline transporter [Aspergillus udagawae]